MNYFIWNGIDSRRMGLWVESLPPITRPPVRYQQITIPGRAGSLTVKEDDLPEAADGSDIYDAYVRECRVMPRPGADIHAILRWLSPGEQAGVVFSNEPKRVQRAEVLDQFDFAHAFACQREATIRFLCDPLKGEYPTPPGVYIIHDNDQDNDDPIINAGDVLAWPFITVRGSGNIAVTIGQRTITFGDVSGAVVADCGAGFAYTGTEVYSSGVGGRYNPAFTDIRPAKMYGDFPYLRANHSNAVTWEGNANLVMLSAQWRYL